jgi:hypothetical protein
MAQQLQSTPASVSLSIIQHGAEMSLTDSLHHAVAGLVAASSTSSCSREFSASELTEAFSALRTRDEKEAIVMKLNESDMIDVSRLRPCT